MDREDHGEFRILAGQIGDSTSDILHGRPEILPTVCRHKQHASGGAGLPRSLERLESLVVKANIEGTRRDHQGVDHTVAGDDDVVLTDVLAGQIRLAGRRWREVQRSDLAGELAVRLLWEW